jgi:two-component system LytT family sensor kinase
MLFRSKSAARPLAGSLRPDMKTGAVILKDMTKESIPVRKRWVQPAFVYGICLLIGITFSIQSYVMANNRGMMITWRDAFAEQVPFWLVWGLLTPLILRMPAKIPIGRQSWVKSLLLHVPAGIVFSFVHLTIYFLILMILQEREAVLVQSLGDFFRIIPKLNLGLRLWSYFLIVAVGYAINYYNRYQEGAVRASELEANLANAQLQALKMQLHPHFLFNTLNSISALLHKDLDSADRMIARLGDFLRLTLENSGTTKVSLQEELQFLQCYIEIERIRFQDRLTLEMDIDSRAAGAQIPNLILQPIVENAIRHGIAARPNAGIIAIRARCNNGKLSIQISDNGPGLPDNGNPRKFHEGLGLSNTRSRLQQLYGTDFKFELINVDGGGAMVILEMPLQSSPIPAATEEIEK